MKIRARVRALTGRSTTNDLSNSDLDDWVNLFYQDYLPDEVKLRSLDTFYTFSTAVGDDEYDKDADYITLRPKVYIDGSEVNLYDDPNLFYRKHPERAVWLSGRAYVVGDTVTSTTSVGYLYTCAVAGTSGGSEPTWPTTLNDTVADGTVTWKYYNNATQKPTDVLLYNDKIHIRPSPNKVYQVKMQATKKPTALDVDTNNNLSDNVDDKCGLVICYGAAIMLLEDKKDTEGAAELAPLYESVLSSLNIREIKQARIHRSSPKW